MGERATEVGRPAPRRLDQPAGRPQGMQYSAEGKEPEEIRADIARTRAELGDTVDRLQERLNPRRLRNDAQEAVQEATIGRAKEAYGSNTSRAGFSRCGRWTPSGRIPFLPRWWRSDWAG